MFENEIEIIMADAKVACDLDPRGEAILTRYLEDIVALLSLESKFKGQVSMQVVKGLFKGISPELTNDVVDNKIREFWAYTLKYAKRTEAKIELKEEPDTTEEVVNKENKTFVIAAEDGVEVGVLTTTWDGEQVSVVMNDESKNYTEVEKEGKLVWVKNEPEETKVNTVDSPSVGESKPVTTEELQAPVVETKYDAKGLKALAWPDLTKLAKEEGFDGQVNKENVTTYLLSIENNDTENKEGEDLSKENA